MAVEKQRHTFISYSRANKDFAGKLARELRSAGFSVWFDQLDIPPGARWDDEVERALRECSIFLIILTSTSTASENVKDEIGYAIDQGKRILPILLEKCDVPLRLRRFQYVDFTTKNFEEGFESAKELLGNLVDEAPAPVIAKTPVVETQIEQKAESEAKVEADRKAKAKATPVQAMPAEMKAKTVSTATAQKKQISKGLVIGIVIVVVLVIAGIGFSSLSKSSNNSLSVQSPATKAPLASNPASQPTKIIPIPTLTPIIFAKWVDVSASELGYPADDDIGARFRGVDDYARKNGFVGGFPNFYFNNKTLYYGTILLGQAAAVWRDVTVSELGFPADDDISARFKAVHDYAGKKDFVGGFPNFYSNNKTLNYGTILLRQGSAEWRDVPASELGFPDNTDIGAMFRAVNDYAESHGFVGGFPNFYTDEIKQVYGVILIIASP